MATSEKQDSDKAHANMKEKSDRISLLMQTSAEAGACGSQAPGLPDNKPLKMATLVPGLQQLQCKSCPKQMRASTSAVLVSSS